MSVSVWRLRRVPARERECGFGRHSNDSLVREALHSQAVVRQGFVWMNSKKKKKKRDTCQPATVAVGVLQESD